MLSEACAACRALGRVTGGSGGGSRGGAPCGGLGGRSSPENFAKIEVF